MSTFASRVPGPVVSMNNDSFCCTEKPINNNNDNDYVVALPILNLPNGKIYADLPSRRATIIQHIICR